MSSNHLSSDMPLKDLSEAAHKLWGGATSPSECTAGALYKATNAIKRLILIQVNDPLIRDKEDDLLYVKTRFQEALNWLEKSQKGDA